MIREIQLAWARHELKAAWKWEASRAQQHLNAIDNRQFWEARVREAEAMQEDPPSKIRVVGLEREWEET